MAWTFMVNASLHWMDLVFDDLSLCSFLVKHSVWIYNRVPNARSGLTPLELVTKEQSDYKDILRCHVWGCPVYVLEAKLQNDQKLPKWTRRACLRQFVGFSDEYPSLVANVRHLTWSHPISMEMREYSRLPTLFQLLRELLVELVGKQKSIHQPCGAVVLMANWSVYH
jgi:hypothetical protein